MSSTRLLAALSAVAILVLAAPAPGRADGDPASDYLLSQKVFIPFDAKITQSYQRGLVATVDRATRSGFPIRVAIIWSDYDLGSVTVLWRRPRQYARFLGVELGFVYKGRLLVVMPNGFGFNRPGRRPVAENALLSKIRIAPTPDGLVQAATTAVERLAAAGGVTLPPPSDRPSAATRTTHDWGMIGVAIAVAIGLGLLLRLWVGRRAAHLSG